MPEINVSELIARFIQNKKISNIFGILSSGFIELADILSETDVNFVGVRHEQWAGHMADVYGRLTSRPQICLIPGGPGITNMVTSVSTARINYGPMMILTDGPTTMRQETYDFQDLNGSTIMDGVAKATRLVSSPRRVLDSLNSLYDISVSPLQGPVHLEISRDILLESIDYEDKTEQPNVISSVFPEPGIIDTFLSMLSDAHKPLILAGEEVRTKEGSTLLEELAETLHIPVCSTHSMNGVMDNSSKYMLGSIGRLGSEKAMKAMQESDLIIALGTSYNPYTFAPYYGFKYPGKSVKVIQITLNPGAMAKNSNLTLGIFSDSAPFMMSVLKRLQDPVNRVHGSAAEWDQWTAKIEISNKPVFKGEHNNSVFREIFDTIPSDAMLSLDAGSMSMNLVRWGKFSGHGSLITSGNMGEVGFSIASSIGAKLAIPSRPSFAVLGDGAFTMEMSAVLTATESEIPIKIILFDNSAWGSEKAYQMDFYNSRFVGSELKNPPLQNLVRSLGIEAIEADSPDKIRAGMKELINLDGSGAIIIRMEDDYPTPVRSLDAVKRVKRGLY